MANDPPNLFKLLIIKKNKTTKTNYLIKTVNHNKEQKQTIYVKFMTDRNMIIIILYT